MGGLQFFLIPDAMSGCLTICSLCQFPIFSVFSISQALLSSLKRNLPMFPLSGYFDPGLYNTCVILRKHSECFFFCPLRLLAICASTLNVFYSAPCSWLRFLQTRKFISKSKMVLPFGAQSHRTQLTLLAQ